METLQQFKLLAMQCATARSPSRIRTSDADTPFFHFRRRTTLKKLLSRSSIRRLLGRGDPSVDNPSNRTEKEGLLSHTLKDLFVSSPPPLDGDGGVRCDGGGSGYGSDTGVEDVGRRFRFEGIAIGRGGGAPRFGSVGLRYRLLRRARRPGLVAIAE